MLYTLAGISVLINLWLLAIGIWVVLPYSILELSVLWLCIYYCVYRCNLQEVITISQFEVLIEKGYLKAVESHNYNRSWAQFTVRKEKHPWDPKVVSIRSHGEEMEIGSFLNKQDKEVLIRELKRVVYG